MLPATPPTAPNPNALRILIVEDEPDIARLVAVTLTPLKVSLHMAATGPQALEAFASIQPHLVLLDVMLPEIDGWTICAKIRETSTVPVIMMTALDSEDSELKGLKAGADDYVAKPFNPKVLAARVATQLRRVYRYDAQPTREESEEERRQREVNTTLGVSSGSAMAERKLPPDWAQCEACGYMGPRAKFEKEDILGRRKATCPNCRSGESLVFGLG